MVLGVVERDGEGWDVGRTVDRDGRNAGGMGRAMVWLWR